MKLNSISAVLVRGQTIHDRWRWESHTWGFGLFHPAHFLQKTNAQSDLQFAYSSVQLSSPPPMGDCSTAKGSHRQDSPPRNWLKFSFLVLPHDLYLEL